MPTMTKERATELTKKFSGSDTNTGKVEVQIAIFTERIKKLTKHFETHSKDHHSKTGLFSLIGKRRALLNYLRDNQLERYRALISELGIKK